MTVNYGDLLDSEISKLQKEIEALLLVTHTYIDRAKSPLAIFSCDMPKPHIPSLRPPQPIDAGAVKVALVRYNKCYIADRWLQDAISWMISVAQPNGITRVYQPIDPHDKPPSGEYLCSLLTPKQILALVQGIRMLRKWIFNRIDGLRRAEQEIAKQQKSAMAALETELAIYILEHAGEKI